jgi:glycosyltransferase involved in cell wall biosynthesis
MRFLYFTTSLLNEDYDAWGKNNPHRPNPSNQNFHARLIQALASQDDVQIVSLVPASKDKTVFVSSKNCHYVNRLGMKLFDRLNAKHSLLQESQPLTEKGIDAIFFDSLNVGCGKAALALGKKIHTPVVAIVTDNPKNLAKVHRIYTKAVFSAVKKSDAVLALSEGLLKAFSCAGKPHLVFEGIVEEPISKKGPYLSGTYFYFAGALKERYGILNLIRAYQKNQPAYDLVIAGHAEENQTLKEMCQSQSRIHFVGQLSKEDNATMEQNAALLINPRPYEKVLDEESVPSKLLEYLASGAPILSTKHSVLQQLFPNDINWIEGTSAEDISSWLSNHLGDDKKLAGLKPNASHDRLMSLYGYSAIGKKVHALIERLNSSTN